VAWVAFIALKGKQVKILCGPAAVKQV